MTMLLTWFLNKALNQTGKVKLNFKQVTYIHEYFFRPKETSL